MARALEESPPVHVEEVVEVRDDMRQTTTERPESVQHLLDLIESEPRDRPLLRLFVKLDHGAKALQRSHNRIAKWAIGSATVALVLAVLLPTVVLLFPPPLDHATVWKWGPILITRKEILPFRFWLAESIAILITIVSVGYGLFQRRHHERLVGRYNAEQLRLLKWRLLTDPGLLRKDGPRSLVADLDAAIDEVVVLDPAQLKALARRERAVTFSDDPGADGDEAWRNAVRAQAAYYRSNRLEAQVAYFRHKAAEEHHSFFALPTLPLAIFAFTTAFVFLHLFFEGVALLPSDEHSEPAERFGKVFLLLATGIPALWAGARTWRAATELARNSMRAAAKVSVLNAYSEELGKPGISSARTYQIFALCEGLLAQEQGEWLRLMVEAEWFL